MMGEQGKKIGLDEVDGAIADGFRLLRFSPALERQFEDDTGNLRCRSMIRLNWIGMMLYHAFLYTDYFSVGDAFQVDLILHFVVMTPLILGINYTLSKRPSAHVREGIEAFGIIVLALTIAVVSWHSRMPDRDIQLLTMVLVVSFSVMMQRMRFRYLVACCFAVQVIYSVALATTMALPIERALLFNSIFLMILVFSLVGAYNLECEHRLSYLLALRERLRGQDLEIVSLHDPLTGIGNRRALEAEWVRQALASVKEPQRSTAVLLLDIDHFKTFNDTNGHQEGDACIRRVARIVTESVRQEEGVVFRFGGEEFLVLMKDASLGEAHAVAERIHAKIADAHIPRDLGAKTFVTVSVGVSAGRLSAGIPADALIAEADAALYVAKRNGRDCVHASVDGLAMLSNSGDRRRAG